MPVTIDITQDLRYQQGVTEGEEKKNIDNAIKMFENDLDISLIQNITGLERSKLESIRQKLTK